MKKAVCLLICVVLLGMTCAAIGENKVLSVGNNNTSILDVAGFGDKVYILTTDGILYGYTLGERGPQILAEKLPNSDIIGSIIAFHEGVYCLDKDTGELRLLAASAGLNAPAVKAVLPITEKVAGAPGIWSVHNLQATDKALYFLYTDIKSDDRILCRYEWANENITTKKITGLFSFSIYRDDQLLISKLEEAGLPVSILDWDTGERQLSVLPRDARGIFYNGDEDSLYYAADNAVMKLEKMQTPVHVVPLSIMNVSEGSGIMLDKQVYVSVSIQNVVYLCDIFSNAGSRTLKLCDNRFPIDKDIKSFVEKYPDVALSNETNSTSSMTTSAFVQALITGELDYDVLCVGNIRFDIRLLMEKGYCAPYPKDSVPWEMVNEMYPPIRQYGFQGDTLFAVPCLVKGQQDVINLQAWEEAGFTKDEIPQSLDSFLDFALRWPERSADIREKYKFLPTEDIHEWLVGMLMDRYVNAYSVTNTELVFDTPLFRQMIKKVESASEAISSANASSPQALLFGKSDDRITRNDIYATKLTHEYPSVVPGEIYVFTISPQSEQYDLAMAYVQSCMENLGSEEQLQLFPDKAEPIIDVSAQVQMEDWKVENQQLQSAYDQAKDDMAKRDAKAALEKHAGRREGIERYYYVVSPEGAEAYHMNIAPNLYFPAPGIFDLDTESGQLIFDLTKRYLAGQINADQFIRELDKKVGMMRLEQQ